MAREAELGMPDTFFRRLDDLEESKFRQWARENYSLGAPVNPMWHPVVRDEIEKMVAEWKVEQRREG